MSNSSNSFDELVPPSEPVTYVLIHGGYERGGSFHKVARILKEANQTVYTPDLPPNEDSPATLADISMKVYRDYVVDLLQKIGRPVVLLGHSLGGLTISAAAEVAPELVRDLVYLSALMIPPGDTVEAFRKRFYGPTAAITDARDDRTVTEDGQLASMGPSGAREHFFLCCSLEDTREGYARLRPQPQKVYYEPQEHTYERWGKIRRTYIVALQDRGLPPPLSAFMLETVGADRVEIIDADHSSYLSAPRRLAKALLEVGALPVKG